MQVADCGQAAVGGILRGMGRQTFVALLNLVGFWVVGLPVGYVLAFHVEGIGVAGLWWGLTAGLTTTCMTGLVVLSQCTNWSDQARAAQERVGE